jgi:hypothetical protein
MGTDNPKISAYVPQVLKERLKQFREERDISESQAVTIILAEYFQIPEVVGRSPEGRVVGGVTLARIETLEERLTDFTTLVDRRLQQLGEEIEKISRSSVVYQVVLDRPAPESEQDSSLPGELLEDNQELEQLGGANKGEHSSPPDEPSNEPLAQELDKDILPSEPESGLPGDERSETEKDSLEAPEASEKQVDESTTSLPSELLNISDSPTENGVDESSKAEDNEIEQQDSSSLTNLLGEPLINERFKPIHGKQVALRWNGSYGNLQNQKSKLSPEDFVKWLTNRDPDHIDWKPIDKPRGHYLPASELSSEILGKLLKWLEDNPV